MPCWRACPRCGTRPSFRDWPRRMTRRFTGSTDNLCLVQTVDVFTPCVDDARLFGQICAANCLSDVYAMGGTPRTALSVLAFPSEKLPGEIIYQMMSGAMEKFAEAGGALVGGHSLKDEEIKLGFAITGVIDPAVAAALGSGRRPVTCWCFTKPLGTGVLTFARQIGRGKIPVRLRGGGTVHGHAQSGRGGSHAGGWRFGLHRCHRFWLVLRICVACCAPRRAGGAEVFAEALPAFPGAVEALRQGVIPGAIERNREYVGDALQSGRRA